MSYQSQAQLAADPAFLGRARAAITEQAVTVYLPGDDRANAALADSLLRLNAAQMTTFTNMLAGAPGFADAVETDDPAVIDSTAVTDPMLLANVQGLWATVAGLYYPPEAEAG